MGAIALPEGNNAADMIRRVRMIDAEVFGTLYAAAGIIGGDVEIRGTLIGNDIISENWDGAIPVDLSVADATAEFGYALDGSEGAAQFQRIYAEGGELRDLDILGTLTLGAGGVFRTAVSGERFEFSLTDRNRMYMYSGDADETYASRIVFDIIEGGSSATDKIRADLQLGSLDASLPDVSISMNGVTRDNSSTDAFINLATRHAGDVGALTLLVIGSGQVKAVSGTAAAPGWSYKDDTDSGWFLDIANRIGIGPALTGTSSVGQTHHGLILLGGGMNTTSKYTGGLLFGSTDAQLTTVNPKLLAGIVGRATETYDTNSKGGMALTFLASHVVPGTSPALDPVWSMYFVTPDESRLVAGIEDDSHLSFDSSGGVWRFTTGGTLEMSLSTSSFTVPNVYNTDQGGGSTVLVDSGGLMHRNSSALRTKTDVYYDLPYLADIRLRPVRYRKNGQDLVQYGFIADDLDFEDRILGVHVDGEIDDFSDRGVMAVMAAKINRLEKMVEALTC